MDVHMLKTSAIEAATVSYEAFKSAALWCGRKIQIGYADYLVPAIRSVWSWGCQELVSLKNPLSAGSRSVFGAAAILFFLGIAAFKIADCKAYDENSCAITAWKAAGIFAFFGATVLAGIGISVIAAI